MRLHEKLKAGKFPNCRKLAEELEVSSKTIQPDIDFMRDRLNLPIEYRSAQLRVFVHGAGDELSVDRGHGGRDRGAHCRQESDGAVSGNALR